MEHNTITQLQDQERALVDQIALLERTVACSAPGIREFRRTRLRQLDEQRLALTDRLRRLDRAQEPAVEAHMLGAAFRDVTRVAQVTFGR